MGDRRATMFLVLEAPHSHLYPGLVGRISAAPEGLASDLREGAVDCAVEFVDGAAAFGRLGAGEGDSCLLSVDAYETRRGTQIPAKRWSLTISPRDGGGAAFRIAKRLPPQADDPPPP